MTESKTPPGIAIPDRPPGSSPEIDDEQRKKEEYEMIKQRVRRMLFGVSCMDCAMKRRKEGGA